jgi:polysaccharide export outer membrane protein
MQELVHEPEPSPKVQPTWRSKVDAAQAANPLTTPTLEAKAQSDSQVSGPDHFVMSVGDTLEVKFPDFPRYDIAVQIRPDGKISLPLIGVVDAAGRTPDELQDEIARRHADLGGQNGKKEYVIQPGDQLDIKFPYQPTFSESLTVRPDGKVQLMLVGTVKAEGMTPEELQLELRKRYGQHLKVPELSVILRSSMSQTFRLPDGSVGRVDAARLFPMLIVRSFSNPQIFVGGEVARPGVFSYRPKFTLMQALIEAGGEKKTGEMASVIVLRKGSGQSPVVIRRDLQKDIYSSVTNDIFLEPADVVIVPKSGIATLGETLEKYVFNLFPFIKNSSLGWSYQIGHTITTVNQ